MKNYIEIIGPCSKYVDGKGWTTLVPEELILAKGYKKVDSSQVVLAESTYLDMRKTISELTNRLRKETSKNEQKLRRSIQSK